jgi:hypothetical protein
VSVLGSLEAGSGEERTVQDQASPHTGSHEEADNILIAFRRAVAVFAENAYVDVISDIERYAELFFKRSADIIVAERKVGGEEDDSGSRIDDAGGSG